MVCLATGVGTVGEAREVRANSGLGEMVVGVEVMVVEVWWW